MPHWLADIAVTAALATFFTALLDAEPVIAWAVLSASLYFVTSLVDEMAERLTGKSLL